MISVKPYGRAEDFMFHYQNILLLFNWWRMLMEETHDSFTCWSYLVPIWRKTEATAKETYWLGGKGQMQGASENPAQNICQAYRKHPERQPWNDALW